MGATRKEDFMRCLGFIMMMTGLLSLIPGQGYATEEKEQQADYEISAPDQATIGSKVQVGWSGKQVTGNYITIVPPSAAEGEYRQYAYTAPVGSIRFWPGNLLRY
jgi:surface antigen